MRLHTGLVLFAAAAASLGPAAGVQECPSVEASLDSLSAEWLTVAEVLTTDAEADDVLHVVHGLSADALRLTAVDVSASPTSLRCALRETALFQLPSGALCRCRDGLWWQAAAPRLPCDMGQAVRDALPRGVDQARFAWPRGKYAAADVADVPSWTAALDAACPSNDATATNWFRFGDTCTYVSETQRPWAEARAQCLAAGGFLLNPTHGGAQNDDAVAVKARKNDGGATSLGLSVNTWVGMYDWFTSNQGHVVKTVNGLGGVDLSLASGGEPSSAAEQCVEMSSSGLNDNDCSADLHYICGFTSIVGGRPPHNDRILVIVDGGDNWLRSDDAGASWTTDTGHETFNMALWADMVGDKVLLVGQNVVRVSNDGGVTFTGPPPREGSSFTNLPYVGATINSNSPSTFALLDNNVGHWDYWISKSGGTTTFAADPTGFDANTQPLSLFFVDSSLAVIGGINSQVLLLDVSVAVDWTPATTDLPAGVSVSAVCGRADRSKIAAFAHSSGAPQVILSTDRGSTFAAVAGAAAFASNVGNNVAIHSCKFVGNTDTLVAVGTGFIQVSIDAGATWAAATTPAGYNNGGNGEFTGLSLTDDGKGVVCGNNFVLLTSDGGLNWTAPAAGVGFPYLDGSAVAVRACPMW